MRILSLDPGEKVGWAVAELDEDSLVPFVLHPESAEPVTFAAPELKIINHGISHLKDMALAVHKKIDTYDVMIYETWRLRGSSAKAMIGNDFPSVQFIGMVRLACWLSPGTQIVDQSPATKSTADRVIPLLYPEIAKRIAAAPKAHDESHDTDALRHLAKWHYSRFIK